MSNPDFDSTISTEAIDYYVFEKDEIPNGLIDPRYNIEALHDSCYRHKTLDEETFEIFRGLAFRHPFYKFIKKIEKLDDSNDDIRDYCLDEIDAFMEFSLLTKTRLLGALSVISCNEDERQELFYKQEQFVADSRVLVADTDYKLETRAITKKMHAEPDIQMYTSALRKNPNLTYDLLNISAGSEASTLLLIKMYISIFSAEIAMNYQSLPAKTKVKLISMVEEFRENENRYDPTKPISLDHATKDITKIRHIFELIKSQLGSTLDEKDRQILMSLEEYFETVCIYRTKVTKYGLYGGLGKTALIVPFGHKKEKELEKQLERPAKTNKANHSLENKRRQKNKLNQPEMRNNYNVSLKMKNMICPS